MKALVVIIAVTIVVTFVVTIVVTFVVIIVVTIAVIIVVTIAVTTEVIGEGIVVVLVVLIIQIVGLQGVHHIAVATIIHHSAHPMLEGLGGRDLGPFLVLLIAQTGGMLLDLGEMWLTCLVSICEQGKKNLFNILS